MGPVSDTFDCSAVAGTVAVVTDGTEATKPAAIDEEGKYYNGGGTHGPWSPNSTCRGKGGRRQMDEEDGKDCSR